MIVALLGCAAGSSHADNSEAVFKRALAYTVQIKTTVALPFDTDHKGSWLGAGFVVDSSRGWIMTNAHVVSRSPSRIQAAFHGRHYIDAKKVYVDPYLDVAIIGVEEGQRTLDISPPELDCGDIPQVGHPVGAFGHPWRLAFTGTRGIISGVTNKYETELLQTDAPINQGNSGGPLISLETGRIVGINTASITESGAQNTNFAVSMKYACRILRLLETGYDPSPPELPLVHFKDIDNRKMLKVARNYADRRMLPLQPGDIVRGISNGEEVIESETQLVHALRGRLDGFDLRVVREGKELILKGSMKPATKVIERSGVYVSGILFGPFTVRDDQEANFRGLMVHHVEKGSLGESLEFQKNDVLESVDGQAIHEVGALYNYLEASRKKGALVTVSLKRTDPSRFAIFTYVERTLKADDLRLIGASNTK